MKSRFHAGLALALLLAGGGPSADEGMWTRDNAPLTSWKARYNLTPDAAWLEHVRLASVRLNDGGSDGFVSSDRHEREGSRAVGVHALGIIEALRNVYDAHALVHELIGRS